MTPKQIRDKHCIRYGQCSLRSHTCIRTIEGGVWYCLKCKEIKLKRGRLVAV